MKNMNQKQCININFSEGLGIFDAHYRYPEIDNQEDHNGPTGKVKDIQGIQAHAGRDFFDPEGKEFSLDIDECPYLHIAVKAGKDTKTCLFLMVHDKKPDDHKNRFVIIGKTPEGDPGIYDVITGCFNIEDDDQWHEYDLDLRKIREKDEKYPYFPGAGSVSIIEFYSWKGSGEHTFHFNDLVCKPVAIASKPFVVKGHVLYADGKPYAGGIVRAFDKDLRNEEPLDTGKTNLQGYYEIKYSSKQFRRAEKGSADLRVCVVDEKDNELVSSDVMFNAPADAVINLTMPSQKERLSEFELLVNVIKPLLKGQGVSFDELNEKDIDFLAKDSGEPKERIAFLAAAAKAALSSGVSSRDEHYKSRAGKSAVGRNAAFAIFYGWFREGLPDQWDQLIEQSIGTLRTAARAAIAHGVIPAELEASIESSIDAMPNPSRDALRAAVTMAGLGEEAIGTVLQYAGAVAEVNNLLVSRLIDEGKIASADAHRMGLGLAAHGLVAGNETTMAAIVSAKPVRLGGMGLQRARDLAAFDVPDIEKALSDANVEPPAGITLASYAARLSGQIAEAFPTDALLYRATNVSDEVINAIERVVAGPARTAPTEGASRARSDPQLCAFINLHPGLGLDKVVDEATNAAAAVSTIKERVAWVDRVRELNPDLDLFAIDYLPESESLKQVKFDGLSDDGRSMVVANLKAYQRVQSVGAGALRGIELLKAGYRSATALARSLPAEIAEKTGLPVAEVRIYHAQAERKANDAALTWFAFHDLERDARTIKHRALLDPPTYLKKLAGYAELFGSPNFCHCEHCRSVLGAAAYFVDLMYFIERHILSPSFKTHDGEQNALHLRRRRPDLWSLELTCDNTNKVVPSLDLVIDFLEKFIVSEKGFASAAQLYEQLANVDYSIRLPFSLPLEQLSILLSHLGIGRRQIGDTFLLRNADVAARARIRLAILPKQFQIITTSRLGDLSAPPILTAQQFFSVWLSYPFVLSVIPGETETRDLNPAGQPLGVLNFARACGLDRTITSTVLATDFVNGAAPGAPPRIRLESGIATTGSIQNDIEIVRNPTSGRLDRFERFVRLWRHIAWTVAELDYVIGRLQKSAGPNAVAQNRLDEAMVIALAQLLDVQDRLQVPVDELCSLWDRVPSTALRGDTSLFDRVFNLSPFVRQQGRWPDATQLIDATASIRARLVAALEINDQDLTIIRDGLDACFGRINTDAHGNRTFVKDLSLNESNLSLLYRHARLAKLLKLSMEELFQTISLTAGIASKPQNDRCVSTLADLLAVLDVHGWRAASGFSLPEALFITKPGSVLVGYDSPDVLAARIAGEVVSEKSLDISLDMFTQIGLTQAESASLIADNSQPVGGNPPLVEQVPGDESYRIGLAVAIEDVAARFLFDPEPRAALISEVARDVFRIVKRGGDAGFIPDALMELGLSDAEAIALIDANLSSTATDGKPFERVPGSTTHYRLQAAVSEAAAIAGFGTKPQDITATKIILTHRTRNLVVRHQAEVARDVYRIVKRGGDVGIEPAALMELGLSGAEAIALVDANLSIAATDGKPFELVAISTPPTPPHYHLRAAVSEASAIAGFGTNPQDFAATKSILRHHSVDLVLRHHAETVLAAKASTAVKVSPEKTQSLLNLAMPSAPAQRQLLVDALQGGPLNALSTLLDRLIRYAVLFRNAAYDPQALEFVRENRQVLALSDPLTAETVRRVSRYPALAAAPDPAFAPDAPKTDTSALQSVLTWTDSIANATTDPQWTQLALALRTNVPHVKGVLSQIALPGGGAAAPRVDELSQLKSAVALTHRLGVAPEILRLAVSEDLAQLARGADGVFAAIRAKYPDAKAFREKLEPFEDKLRSRTRDGLVEYLLSAPDDATTDWRKRFESANDLYHHFLTDVMIEGCARTSKVVAAISSVQLYVHRVLMNLEQSEGSPVMAARFDDTERQEEWKWRKNYQVWVANRKVFLYPENYIEPGLRDDKTPLFKELEDTLLQQQITEQNVLDGYAKYLHGFEEVARLRIAGAYHDRHGLAGDLLHLFGVTSSDPPVYYYRTIRNLDSGAGPVFSAWQKMDMQIPVRKVSPIVFLGRLYVFWVETTTRQLSDFKEGSSTFKGYRHSVRTKFSQLRIDGHWTPPQNLKTFDEAGEPVDVRLVDDPVSKRLTQALDEDNVTVLGTFDLSKDFELTAFNLLVMFRRNQGKNTLEKTLLPNAWWDSNKNRDHTEPLENYTPEGWKWERTYPQATNDEGQPALVTMFVPRSDPMKIINQEALDLWSLTAVPISGHIRMTDYLAFTWMADSQGFALPGMALPSRTRAQVLNGNEKSRMMEADQQILLAQYVATAGTYRLWRCSTSMASELGEQVAVKQIHGMLDLLSQLKLGEAAGPFTVTNSNLVDSERMASKPYEPFNSFGTYFREVFFHIPFLIADHLNSQQKFAEAQRWYHYLYNPTASESGVDEKKRPWRYREFREQEIQTLRKAMTDPNALAAYRLDPFNPHAIAGLRPGAYQKSILMKYIDNLLDWGDSLFSQFTMESVNEATMLYVMAADILGPRPTELGPCGETSGSGKTYADIAPLLRPADPNAESTADFLIEEFEVFTLDGKGSKTGGQFIVHGLSERATMSQAATVRSLAVAGMAGDGGNVGSPGGPPDPAGWNKVGAQTWKDKAGIALADLYLGNPIGGAVMPAVGGQAAPRPPLLGDPVGPSDPSVRGLIPTVLLDRFGMHDQIQGFDRDDYLLDKNQVPDKTLPPVKLFELAHSRLVFCIPENKELRGYWDRVEDRLNKIRNCMDIAGVRRSLELFAPEIDPRMLVRMRAAGLSLDDVMNVTSGNLPPYRFTYLIEKAKQHAGLVQNFGSQVLSALEKRDGEELTRLRSVHEQNLLKLRSQMTQWEIDAAEDTLENLRRQRTAAEYRRDHYLGLVQDGLSAPERVQQVATHLGSTLASVEALGALASAIASLVPNFGAPTAMTFGGREVSHSMISFAGFAAAMKDASKFVGESAGLEAGNQRRNEDWLHQFALARKDIDYLAKQITAAEIRRDIAAESLKIHERSVEQVQEIFDFLRDRFTNFGRFTWLSAELQKLHRMAFNASLSMARLAEQACHFEHPNEAVKPGLTGAYWDAGNAGLLAGDRLMLDLHNLERGYIETHQRTLEIEQSFSLAQFAPDMLATLQLTGECTFKIPEWFFDLTYPGQYRRRLKAVRLTIPCVTGPYTNVGASLRLESSMIRLAPELPGVLTTVPLRHTVAIAASKAQYDTGVFDFSFRDERYMPFEGAGVISDWQLSLPKTLRVFDYGTISDVIVHLSYTAEFDGLLKENIEKEAEGIILELKKPQSMTRSFSLRHEFPDAFHRLSTSLQDTEVDFTIEPRHFPFFLMGRTLRADVANLRVLSTEATLIGATLRIKEKVLVAPNLNVRDSAGPAESTYEFIDRGMREFDLGSVLKKDQFSGITPVLTGDYVIQLAVAGPLGPAPSGTGMGVIDPEKLHDIVLEIGYGLA